METFLAGFAVGMFWWWILVVVASIIIIAAVENDAARFATLTLIVIGVVSFSVNPGLWAWIAANKLRVLGGILLYFALGTGWGMIKWEFFIRKCRDLVQQAVHYACKRYSVNSLADVSTLDAEVHERFWFSAQSHLPDYRYQKLINASGRPYGVVPPTAADNKARILGWMTYWPWSALWTLINDPIRRLWHWIYTSLAGYFQDRSSAVFEDIK